MEEGEFLLWNFLYANELLTIPVFIKHVRTGKYTYDFGGNRVNGFPVFLKTEEIKARGLDPDKLWQ